MSGAGRHSCSRRASGFTLLETLIVVAITALIAMIVVPNLVGSLAMLDLQQTTRLLQADLRVARATAIRTGQKVDLEATNHGREYDWIGGSRFLPEGITLSMSNPLVVYPDGSVQTAGITLSARHLQYAINVDPVNGSVTVAQR
jgi:prepilin-type N-terminal cleavage/methylation domain-containing protein